MIHERHILEAIHFPLLSTPDSKLQIPEHLSVNTVQEVVLAVFPEYCLHTIGVEVLLDVLAVMRELDAPRACLHLAPGLLDRTCSHERELIMDILLRMIDPVVVVSILGKIGVSAVTTRVNACCVTKKH